MNYPLNRQVPRALSTDCSVGSNMPWPDLNESNNNEWNFTQHPRRTMLQMAADRDRQRCSGVTAANAKANATSPTQTTSLKDSIRAYLYQPQNWIAPILAAGVGIGLWSFYQNYLRRFPGSEHIAPSFFRRRSLPGKVTSVGDGDGFHLVFVSGDQRARVLYPGSGTAQ